MPPARFVCYTYTEEVILLSSYQDDICPIMSIGRIEPANCTSQCAWFDTERMECAVSAVNGSLKNLRPGDYCKPETM